jgi:sugar phosphate isomerase/epimerase
MALSRRSLLQMGAGAATAWLAGGGFSHAANAAVAADAPAETKKDKKMQKIPIGLQLYSVRDACAKDLPGVLEALGKMGYKGVEFAGYYNRTAADLRKLLDQNGLVCCGTHTGLETLLGDSLKRTIEFNKTMGNKYLIVPAMGPDRLGTTAAIKKTAQLFNELAEKVKADGMLVGYHAHGGDFKKLDGGETAWDLFFTEAKPPVIMQLDIGNCKEGGGDPYAILKKFPGRATTIHIKEYGGKPGAVIGEGQAKWDEVFRDCEAGGTQWYVVEQESYGTDKPIDSVRKCLESLKKMGKA